MNHRLAFFAVSAAALALAACDKGADSTANTTVAAGPIEPIPAPNNGDWSEVVTQTAEGGMLMGNPDAPVKLVEFASMTCPHCREFEEAAMQPLIDTYVKSGRVSFEFRNFVRDGLDLTATIIARCNGPEGFFGLTRQMFADQATFFERLQSADQSRLQAITSLPPAQQLPQYADVAGLKEWAAQRGLPSAKADQCLSDQGRIDRLVQMQTDAASTYNIPGTPSFLVNGKLIEIEGGTPVWTQVESKLRDAIG